MKGLRFIIMDGSTRDLPRRKEDSKYAMMDEGLKTHYDTGIKQIMHKACELGKLDPCGKKSTTVEAQGNCAWGVWVGKTRLAQRETYYDRGVGWNVSEVCESEKLNSHEEKPTMAGARQSVLEVCESRKSDPCKEISVTTGAHDKICLRHVSQENLTCIKGNSLRWRCRAKYARYVWVRKT